MRSSKPCGTNVPARCSASILVMDAGSCQVSWTRVNSPPTGTRRLIAFTAAEHNATLLSLDQQAAATYETVGTQVEQLLG